ncbi:hypothetical protein CPB85DRAFT_119827 [Mucidula mucida]|nr:hypothetical protein CPB85DRAFT_119827 [Mucidula mucida]
MVGENRCMLRHKLIHLLLLVFPRPSLTLHPVLGLGFVPPFDLTDNGGDAFTSSKCRDASMFGYRISELSLPSSSQQARRPTYLHGGSSSEPVSFDTEYINRATRRCRYWIWIWQLVPSATRAPLMGRRVQAACA